MSKGEIMNEIKKKKYNIKVVNPAEREQYISDNDMEMDLRASAAVKAALNKAEICKKPIAKYDKEKKKAYVEYPSGRRVIVRKHKDDISIFPNDLWPEAKIIELIGEWDTPNNPPKPSKNFTPLQSPRIAVR